MTRLRVAPEELYGHSVEGEPYDLARRVLALTGRLPLGSTLDLADVPADEAAAAVDLSAADVVVLSAAGRPGGWLRLTQRHGGRTERAIAYAVPGLVVRHELLRSGRERLTAASPEGFVAQVQAWWRQAADGQPAAAGDPWRWAVRVDLLRGEQPPDQVGAWIALLGKPDGTVWATGAAAGDEAPAAEPVEVVSDEADDRVAALLAGCGAFDPVD